MKNKEKKNNLTVISIFVIIIIVSVLLFIFLFTNKKYEIEFNTDGGNYLTSLKVKRNGLIEKPEDPQRDGYEFVGWYLDDLPFDFNTKVTKNLKLVAKWEKMEDEMTFKETNINMLVNDELKLDFNLPNEVNEQDLLWSSSDEQIATVKDGVVKALKNGKVIITLKTKDGKYSTNIEINITDKEVNVTEVTISGNSTVTVGNSIKLTANILPDNATNKKVTWKSSNSKIATVDNNGNIKGISVGTVTITVTTEDSNKTATRKITVQEKNSTTKKATTTTKPTTTIPTTTTTTTTSTTSTTTTTTKKQKVYKLVLSAEERADGGVAFYRFGNLTEDGRTISDWKSVNIGGKEFKRQSYRITSNYATRNSNMTVTVTLSDDSKVEAQILWDTIKVDD